MRLFAVDLPVVQTLAGALLAVLAVFLAFRVWRGADTGLALCPPVRVAPWGLPLVLCLLAAFGVYFAAGLSLPSVFFVVTHPLSCLWGVAVVSKFIIKDFGPLRYWSTFEEAVRTPLAYLTVTSFLRYLPKKLSGSLGYDWRPYQGAPAGGFGPFVAPTLPSLGLVTWTVDLFRQNQALQLHVHAFASFLVSTRGLVLSFLRTLPWAFLGEGVVRLGLSPSLVPRVLLLERLFEYAGLSGIRFTLQEHGPFTLIVSLDELLAVARLGGGRHRKGPLASPQALGEYLQSGKPAFKRVIQAGFYRPLEFARPSRPAYSRALPLTPVRRRR
jgi:hypothetical protein